MILTPFCNKLLPVCKFNLSESQWIGANFNAGLKKNPLFSDKDGQPYLNPFVFFKYRVNGRKRTATHN